MSGAYRHTKTGRVIRPTEGGRLADLVAADEGWEPVEDAKPPAPAPTPAKPAQGKAGGSTGNTGKAKPKG